MKEMGIVKIFELHSQTAGSTLERFTGSRIVQHTRISDFSDVRTY